MKFNSRGEAMMDERNSYIHQVFETALYFRDMYEESNDGQTTAIELLKPVKSIRNTDVRKFVLHDLYRNQKLSLTEAALQFARWTPDDSKQPPFNVEDIKTDLIDLCQKYERDTVALTDENAIKRRSFLRAARYLERIAKEKAPAHSRVVELFIPEAFVPRGFGNDGGGHREHVVPCVLLRDECIVRYKNGAELTQVADFLQRHVVIIEITKDQQKHLDGSKEKGGRGLKNKMPKNWEFGSGCIFARLHDAEINFVPPPGFSICNHCSL
jgi:hypothetical protein